MKNIYKIFLLLILCSVFVFACSKETEQEKYLRLYDLNKNGVVEDWEEPFFAGAEVRRDNDIIFDISSAQQLIDMAASDKTGEDVAFKLVKDIDFSEIELTESIDLNGTMLYGNNKVIKNFNFKKMEGKNFALIKNASAVFDVKVYLGYVHSEELSADKISVFDSCLHFENVHVKGRIEVSGNVKNMSLFTSDSFVSIKNSTVLGDVFFTYVGNSSTITSVGAFAFSGDGSLLNATADFDVIANGKNNIVVGGLVSSFDGFMENSYVDCTIEFGLHGSLEKVSAGGLVGVLEDYGEIKNCKSNVTMVASGKKDSEDLNVFGGKLSAGGIAGVSFGSIFNTVSVGSITGNSMLMGTLGGMVGASKNAIFSKNISNVTIYANDNNLLYAAGIGGNVVGGLIQNTIVNSSVDVKATSDKVFKYSNIVNIGLIYFHSELFISGVSTSDATGDVLPRKAPSIANNLFVGENVINYESLDKDDVYQFINVGGVWQWVKKHDLPRPARFSRTYYYNNTQTLLSVNKEQYDAYIPKTDSDWLLQDKTATLTKNVVIRGSAYGFNNTDFAEYEGDFEIAKLELINKYPGSYYERQINLENDTYFNRMVDSKEELSLLLEFIVAEKGVRENLSSLAYYLDENADFTHADAAVLCLYSDLDINKYIFYRDEFVLLNLPPKTNVVDNESALQLSGYQRFIIDKLIDYRNVERIEIVRSENFDGILSLMVFSDENEIMFQILFDDSGSSRRLIYCV